MNGNSIRDVVLRVLGEVAPEADLQAARDDVSIQEQFDIDSMDFLNFVSGLAQATGVEVPERDYPSIATIGGCVSYLSERSVRAG